MPGRRWGWGAAGRKQGTDGLDERGRISPGPPGTSSSCMLSARVPSGMSAEVVRAEIAALQAKSPLWQFRANCLYYCRFVHAHHGGEDHLHFPIVRRTNPELGGVVDRLEADHR